MIDIRATSSNRFSHPIKYSLVSITRLRHSATVARRDDARADAPPSAPSPARRGRQRGGRSCTLRHIPSQCVPLRHIPLHSVALPDAGGSAATAAAIASTGVRRAAVTASRCAEAAQDGGMDGSCCCVMSCNVMRREMDGSCLLLCRATATGGDRRDGARRATVVTARCRCSEASSLLCCDTPPRPAADRRLSTRASSVPTRDLSIHTVYVMRRNGCDARPFTTTRTVVSQCCHGRGHERRP